MTVTNPTLSRRLILMIMAVVVGFCAKAATIEQADSTYAHGRYSEAIALYDSIAKANGVSASLLYNEGNAAYRNSNLGLAALCYERALRLDPGNRQIRNNLAVVNSRVADLNNMYQKGKLKSLEPDSPTFFEMMRGWYAGNFSANFWGTAAAVCFILMLAGVGCYLFSRSVTIKKTGFFSALVLLVISCLFIFFAFSSASYVKDTSKGIIMEPKLVLLKDPATDAEASATPLSDGTKVQILERTSNESGEWCRVRLNANFTGWAPASAIETI